ncbi:MAG: hypothetical protein IH971_10100 [Candidatus Marinimicrobia bacterium]|nr:hypothetical protein [Candidatus Neomarinimicrobiota bacterium]
MRNLSAYCVFISSVVIFLAVSACSQDEEFVFEGTVSIEAQDSSLVIFNQTNATIYVFAIEQETSNAVDLRFCDDPNDCVHTAIKPGDSKEIPHTSILGWKPGAVVLVYLYYLTESSSSDSGYRAVGLPMQTVEMPFE